MSIGVDGLPGHWMVLLCRISGDEGNFRADRS